MSSTSSNSARDKNGTYFTIDNCPRLYEHLADMREKASQKAHDVLQLAAKGLDTDKSTSIWDIANGAIV